MDRGFLLRMNGIQKILGLGLAQPIYNTTNWVTHLGSGLGLDRVGFCRGLSRIFYMTQSRLIIEPFHAEVVDKLKSLIYQHLAVT
jgi:hypothetical protein